MANKTSKLIKTDPMPAIAIRVGGPLPYVGGPVVSTIGYPNARAEIQSVCTQPYQKPVDVVVLTTADFRRLCKAAGINYRVGKQGG